MKIIILGSSGSGKSTLSLNLSKILNIDVFHLDSLFWLENWQQINKEIFLEKIKNILLKDSFILDGNYSNNLFKERIEIADIIIFLDISRYICLYSVIKRYFKYKNKTRPDMAKGCKEQIDLEFIKWIWNYPKRSRNKTLELLEKNKANKRIYILKNRTQIKKFITDFRV